MHSSMRANHHAASPRTSWTSGSVLDADSSATASYASAHAWRANASRASSSPAYVVSATANPRRLLHAGGCGGTGDLAGRVTLVPHVTRGNDPGWPFEPPKGGHSGWPAEEDGGGRAG